MIKFKQKDFSSIKEDIVKGSVLGASIGTALSSVVVKRSPLGKKALTYGALIGAALGTLSGSIKWVTEKISRQNAANHRIIDKLSTMLTNCGYKDNLEFTKDPKMANLLKTKVCLMFSKSHSEFKVLVNTVNDPKLHDLVSKAIKLIPSSKYPVISEQASDRFNEVQIISIPSKGDINILLDMIMLFIDNGYSTYLVEVG